MAAPHHHHRRKRWYHLTSRQRAMLFGAILGLLAALAEYLEKRAAP